MLRIAGPDRVITWSESSFLVFDTKAQAQIEDPTLKDVKQVVLSPDGRAAGVLAKADKTCSLVLFDFSNGAELARGALDFRDCSAEKLQLILTPVRQE
jgi:hypothetical protein